MARRLFIPAEVLDAISAHISTSIERAIQGFWSANEDEDTLTGHLGACLKTGMHTVIVTQDEINGPWKWSIDYAKFRGRGKNATEFYLGADGILELSVDMGSRTDTKSLLFQAKTDWVNSPDIVEQAIVMSTWREAAIGINYTPTSFDAYSIDNILSSRGVKANARGAIPLQDALSQYFIRCKIGNTDLRYDARSRRLYWRDVNGLLVSVQFSVPQRIRLNVEAPAQGKPLHADKELTPAEISQHRMEVQPKEVLMPLLAPVEIGAKLMKRTLAMTYHPDRYSAYDQLFRDLATRRMQEVNAASDELAKRDK
jgi:hypothetical protein